MKLIFLCNLNNSSLQKVILNDTRIGSVWWTGMLLVLAAIHVTPENYMTTQNKWKGTLPQYVLSHVNPDNEGSVIRF